MARYNPWENNNTNSAEPASSTDEQTQDTTTETTSDTMPAGEQTQTAAAETEGSGSSPAILRPATGGIGVHAMIPESSQGSAAAVTPTTELDNTGSDNSEENNSEEDADKDKEDKLTPWREGSFYDGGWEVYNRKNNPGYETDDQRKKREKREKWAQTIAALSDLATGFINIGTSAAGGLSTWDGKNTLSEAARERIDKANEQRQKEYNSYFDRYVKEREMDRKDRKERLEAKQREIDEEYNAKIREINLALAEGKLKAQEAELKYKEAEEKRKQEAHEAQMEYYGARTYSTIQNSNTLAGSRSNQNKNRNEQTKIKQQNADTNQWKAEHSTGETALLYKNVVKK